MLFVSTRIWLLLSQMDARNTVISGKGWQNSVATLPDI